MTTDASTADRVGALAEEFVQRYRRGERPALAEYCDKHPEFAERIRALFPALVMMEELAPEADDSGGESVRAISGTGAVAGEKLERVGECRILREIGRGGMGIVYEAEQESLGRHVALKVLPAHTLLHPEQLKRFHREARAAAKLHHTNIVPVFGVGEQSGLHYYVMQFIQGQGLDEVLLELKRLRQQKDSRTARPQEQPTPPGGSEAHAALGATADRPYQTGKDFSASDVAQALLSGQFAATIERKSEAQARGPKAHACEQKPEAQAREQNPETQAREQKPEAQAREVQRSSFARVPGFRDGFDPGSTDSHVSSSTSSVVLPGQSELA